MRPEDFARKARFLMTASGGPYSDQMVQELYVSLKEAHDTGWTNAVMQFKTLGTDGCQSCETGRITLFTDNFDCLSCQNKKVKP